MQQRGYFHQAEYFHEVECTGSNISRQILLRNSKVICRQSLHFLIYRKYRSHIAYVNVKGCHHKFVRFVLVTIAKIGPRRQVRR